MCYNCIAYIANISFVWHKSYIKKNIFKTIGFDAQKELLSIIYYDTLIRIIKMNLIFMKVMIIYKKTCISIY